MKGLLVRVGADQSEGGGCWNGPVDSKSRAFTYVPIPECSPIRPGLRKPYRVIARALGAFGTPLPPHLETRNMHLDPDFEHLTYGDQGQRAKQIARKIREGDLLVFYAGLKEPRFHGALVYAIIGLYVVDELISAVTVPSCRRDENAHTRRVLPAGATDIVVRARSGVSGRLKHCIPIGSYRERAYRVLPRLLKTWGGLTVNDGYLQRSARLPELKDAARFYQWFVSENVPLLERNN